MGPQAKMDGQKERGPISKRGPSKKMWNWRVVVRNLNVIQKIIFSFIWLENTLDNIKNCIANCCHDIYRNKKD